VVRGAQSLFEPVAFYRSLFVDLAKNLTKERVKRMLTMTQYISVKHKYVWYG
jgi:hypothetical protein